MNKMLPTFFIKEPTDQASLLKSYFHQSQQYQVLLNKRFQIKSFNKYADVFTQKYYSTPLAEGNKIWQYITPSFSDDYQLLANKALSGEKVEYEIFLQKENNTPVWFQFCIVPITDNNKRIQGFMLEGTNISKQKENEKVIRQQSEILSIIAQLQSHQVRQPLCSIMSLTNLLKEDFKNKRLYLKGLENATHELDTVLRIIVNQVRKD